MRKEADDTGPMAELDHWRHLMARFNSIVEQVKGKHCKMVINVLHIARSKVLRVNLLYLHLKKLLLLQFLKIGIM